MIFQYENQMVEPAENWLISKGLMTRQEFSTAWGICDLVGCSLNKRNVKKRLTLCQNKPIGPPLRVLMLSKIPDEADGRSMRRKSFQRFFIDHFDNTQIERELERLIECKFVRKTNFGTLQKINGWMPLHRKLIAIELKLSRVSEALVQACNNLEFADESYVGLPSNVANSVVSGKNKEVFLQNNIGLLAVDKDKCRVVLKPRQNNSSINPITQTHVVERFWRNYITSSEA